MLIENDGKNCPVSRLGFKINHSAVGIYQPVDNWKPKACSVRFGGIKGVKDVPGLFLWNPRASILNNKIDTIAFWRFKIDPYNAFSFDCLGCIIEKIPQSLLQMGRINKNTGICIKF